MSIAFVLASVVVYALAIAAIAWGLAGPLRPGQNRVAFAAIPVAHGQYAIVSVTALLLHLDGPAFAYPFIASCCLVVVALVVAVAGA